MPISRKLRSDIWFFCLNRAIPTIMVGIAFFLVSCQQKIAVKKELVIEPPKYQLKDQFAMAEAYRQRGYFREALNAYGAYLNQYPRGEKSALALHRTEDIYFKTKQYEKVLAISHRIENEHPDYAQLPVVHYQNAEALYYLGKYLFSKEDALKWIERYPGHRLEGDVLILLGNNNMALENRSLAFKWWLKAEQKCPDNVQKKADLKKKLERLIQASGVQDLEKFAAYAEETDYAPKVYYRIALICMECNDLKKAEKATMSLVASTQEESWVISGQQLLDRIQEEISVRKGIVGCLLPLSGPFSIYGEKVLNGIQLGMRVFNGAGQDLALELVIKDTQGEEEQTLAALEDLVNSEKVMAVIGPLSSRTALVAAKKAQNLGVPMITLTQKDGIVQERDMIFRNILTPSQEVKRLLDVAIDEIGIRRFGILYPDNSYGRFFMNLFWDRLEEMGGVVTAVESYNPDDTDFSSQIKKMTGLYYPRPDPITNRLWMFEDPEQEENQIKPDELEPIVDFDAVFIPDNFQRVAMIAPQLAYHDVSDVLLMGTSLWQSPKLIEMASDYIQNSIFSSGFFAGSGEPEVSYFVENYEMSFGSIPGVLAATGYDTIRLFKRLMAEGGIRSKENFRAALLRCKDFKGVTGNISFDYQGDVKKEPLLLTISGKKMILLN